MRRSADYHAFLLRLWRENNTAPWRFAIQQHQDHEPLGFATLNELLTFLHYLMQLDGATGIKPIPTEQLDENSPPANASTAE